MGSRFKSSVFKALAAVFENQKFFVDEHLATLTGGMPESDGDRDEEAKRIKGCFAWVESVFNMLLLFYLPSAQRLVVTEAATRCRLILKVTFDIRTRPPFTNNSYTNFSTMYKNARMPCFPKPSQMPLSPPQPPLALDGFHHFN